MPMPVDKEEKEKRKKKEEEIIPIYAENLHTNLRKIPIKPGFYLGNF